MNRPSEILPDSASFDSVFSSRELQKMLSHNLLDPLTEFLERPAKNIRSELVELGFCLSQDKDPSMISEEDQILIQRGSAIVELIHSGSLIVDDIQDSSSVRRNRPALHIVHGLPLALNAGNWLYFWALSQLNTLNFRADVQQECTDDIIRMMMKAHAGQALDIGTRIDLIPKKIIRETCLASMELKSGILMSLAMRLGAAIAGRPWTEELHELGSTIGVILQMYDDIGNFMKESPKRFEDLNLRRPTWIWAVVSEFPEEDFNSFIHAINDLPDERRLNKWNRENDFVTHLLGEASMFSLIHETFWKNLLKKTHPQCLEKILHVTKKLEQAYVS